MKWGKRATFSLSAQGHWGSRRRRSLACPASNRCTARAVCYRPSFSWRLVIGAGLAAGFAYGVQRMRDNPDEFKALAEKVGYSNEERCFLENYEFISDAMRPVVDCNICRNVASVGRVRGLTQDEFMDKYAFTGTPVVVTDALANWTAGEHFGFEYFKSLYGKDSPNVKGEGGEECQFFPYQTKFNNLGEVFAMSKDRRSGTHGKPWYIGW